MDVRSVREIIKQPINIFNGVLDNDCSHIVTMRGALKGIKEGNWRDEIEWYRQETDKTERESVKKRFPGVTFSGTFKERRLDRNLDYYTGVLVIDIDKKDMESTYEEIFECVKRTPFVFCAFESPSHGIKALAYSEIPAGLHKLYFRGVEEYFMDQYGIEIDTSGKNPGRLCFISHDPNMYICKGVTPFEVETYAPRTFKEEKDRDFREVTGLDYSQYESSYDMEHIMETAKKWTERSMGAYRKGNRNNYVFYLGCILSEAGVDKNSAIDVIFANYRSLGLEEVKTTVLSAYRTTLAEFGSKPILKKKTNQKKLL